MLAQISTQKERMSLDRAPLNFRRLPILPKCARGHSTAKPFVHCPFISVARGLQLHRLPFQFVAFFSTLDTNVTTMPSSGAALHLCLSLLEPSSSKGKWQQNAGPCYEMEVSIVRGLGGDANGPVIALFRSSVYHL